MSSSFVSTGQWAEETVLRLHSEFDNENWKPSMFSDNIVSLFSRKTEDPAECVEDIIRGTVILKDVDVARVVALVAPWLPYRAKWDELLDRAETVEEIDEVYKIIHHITKKKMPLTARDSVDVVAVRDVSPSMTVFAVRSTDHPSVPPTEKAIRTFGNIGGYVIEQIDKDVRFTIYFQSDLKLKAPRFISALVDGVKPRFMADKLRSLVKAAKTMDVSNEHIKARQ